MPDHGHEEHGERAEVHQLWRIAEGIEKIEKHLACICKALQPPPATDFQLIQGEKMGAITGVQVGSSDFFTALLVPANAAPLQSGPVFSVTDSLVTLTPDSTNTFKVTAAVDASDTNLSFDLKVDGVNSLGAAISHTFTIPILQAPPPAAVDFDLSQGA
jgi:hypothetical protein